MKIFWMVVFGGILMATAACATTWTVDVHNFAFVPAALTIAHGDTVHWHASNGTHNVHHVGVPSLFGRPIALAPWDYEFVFDSIGDSTFHYICEVHPTLMQGTITVLPPTITVTSPNGGELWIIGSTDSIRWVSARLPAGGVTIQLNRDFPAGAWEPLADGMPDSGSFGWVVTGPASANARVRVFSVTMPNVGDTSDADFAIQSLAAPDGLTILPAGNDVSLNWLAVPGADGYAVYRSVDSTTPIFPELVGTTTGTALLDLGVLTTNDKYFYQVLAVKN